MLKKLSTRKALSLVLSLVMLFGTVFTGFSAYAEETTTEFVAPKGVTLSSSDYSDVDFTDTTKFVGGNLIPDSTVKEFAEDGTYKNYYVDPYGSNPNAKDDADDFTVANANAWWDKGAKNSSSYESNQVAFKPLNYRGRIVDNVSHTDDGSGALNISSDSGAFTQYVAMTDLIKEKYYLVTYWATNSHSAAVVYDYTHPTEGSKYGNEISRNFSITTAGTWQRFSFIVAMYDAGNPRNEHFKFYTASGKECYIDEFEIYELDATYAENCIAATKLLSARDLRDEKAKYINVTDKGTSTNYSDIDFSKYGENLILDSTVNFFDEDGIYKYYYKTNADGDYDVSGSLTSAGTNAIWDKGIDTYQFKEAIQGNFANYYLASPNFLGFVSPENESHTADGSGSINVDWSITNGLYEGGTNYKAYMSKSFYLPLPTLAYKEYYVVTFWIKSTAAQEFVLKLCNKNSNQFSTQTNISATTDWKRVSILWYTGGTANISFASVDLYQADNKIPYYIDDVEVYKLDETYFNKCYDSGMLLTEKDELPAEGKYFDTTFDASNNAYDYSEVDFSQYGENLVPDSTIADFDGDTYMDYDAATNKGWWAQHTYKDYSTTGVNMWNSMKSSGYISNDSSLSHTADGSGVLSIPASKNITLPLPKFEKKTYYLVTYWIKSTAGANLRYMPVTSAVIDKGYANFGSYDWERVTFVVYTGSSQIDMPKISVYTNAAAYIDDIAVYELDYEYGEACYELGRLKTEKDDRPNDRDFKVLDSNIWGVHMPSFGENLVKDSDVSYFDENKNYKPYYDNETIGAGSGNVNTIDTNATWAKVVNMGQYYDQSVLLYGSMKNRDLIVNNFTHNNDGTGSLKVEHEAYLPMPTLSSYNDYYLITYWAYTEEQISIRNKINSPFYTTLYENTVNLNKGWNRVALLVYVGDTSFAPFLYFHTGNKQIYLDDIGVYKLDYAYGKQAAEEGKLPANRERVAGDVNCDDVVNMKDLVRMKKLIAGITDDALRLNADLVGGGEINAEDIAKLSQYIVGNISSLS